MFHCIHLLAMSKESIIVPFKSKRNLTKASPNTILDSSFRNVLHINCFALTSSVINFNWRRMRLYYRRGTRTLAYMKFLPSRRDSSEGGHMHCIPGNHWAPKIGFLISQPDITLSFLLCSSTRRNGSAHHSCRALRWRKYVDQQISFFASPIGRDKHSSQCAAIVFKYCRHFSVLKKLLSLFDKLIFGHIGFQCLKMVLRKK